MSLWSSRLDNILNSRSNRLFSQYCILIAHDCIAIRPRMSVYTILLKMEIKVFHMMVSIARRRKNTTVFNFRNVHCLSLMVLNHN